uniref:Uncharacterized protein n=2 Tax=Tetranychus urticae TaxID=32264 RepID=T1JVS6_TETUR
MIVLLVFTPQSASSLSRRKMMKIKKLAALAMILKPKKKMMPIPIPIPIPIFKDKMMMMKGNNFQQDQSFQAQPAMIHGHLAFQPAMFHSHVPMQPPVVSQQYHAVPVPMPIRVPVPVPVQVPAPVQPLVALEYHQEPATICHH